MQAVVFPSDICADTELYFRANEKVSFEKEHIHMLPNGKLTTDTYMNLFDASVWRKYTGINGWKIIFQVSGRGRVKLRTGNTTVAELEIDCAKISEKQIPFTCGSDDYSWFYLDIESIDTMELSDIRILVNETEQALAGVCLALNICTFHRQEVLYHSLDVIRNSRFFQKDDSLYGKLQVYVVDNASEISIPEEAFISVYHNPNTGGSGGFTRGLVEIRREIPKTGVTHVVFMDDDVEFILETLYRLYALLSLIKEEYKDEVVAGRMFRMDDRKVQYTAAEIWNRGEIKHLGFNADMTQSNVLKDINNNTGAEYGGWWFCCFPMGFAKENDPLPFFLHCDDVEYGLRHGGMPIILNGIQVWHETYEYRQTPIMAYYDMRNKLFVNSIHCKDFEIRDYISYWKEEISIPHIQKDYLREYMMIKGVSDFYKGIRWLNWINGEKLNKKLQQQNTYKIKNSLFWRITMLRMKIWMTKESGNAVTRNNDRFING